MANEPHSSLSGSDLHEPKGVASANDGDVYVADGAGSGTWTSGPGYRVLVARFALTNSTSAWIVTDVAGDIIKAYSVIDAAVATADAVITLKINTVAVTDGVITITSAGSAAGDVDSCTPSAANTVAVGDAIEIAMSNGFTGTVTCNLTIVIAV